jgi:hypothetical protein
MTLVEKLRELSQRTTSSAEDYDILWAAADQLEGYTALKEDVDGWREDAGRWRTFKALLRLGI